MKGFFKSEKTADEPSKKPAATSTYSKASQVLAEEAQPKPIVLNAPMTALFKACGNDILFSDTAIEALRNVKNQLESLLQKFPEEAMQSAEIKGTRKSIVLLVELLDKLVDKNKQPIPTNNLNYFISPLASAFYHSLEVTPSVNNELAAHATEILFRALKEHNFSGELFPNSFIKRTAYNGYTRINGDQIQIAANYLRAKLDVYAYAKDNSDNTALMEAVKSVTYNASRAREFATESKTHGRALNSFDHVVTTMQKSNLQFQADAPRGFASVAAGAVLKNLAQCQDEIVSKNVSKASIAPVTFINVDVPPAADENKYNNLKSRIVHFDANLLKECKRICDKPSSEEEGKVFDDLRVKLKDFQRINAAAPNIAMDLVNRYAAVSHALEAHAIWNANPQANALLKACDAEMKEMMGNYSLDLTAKELSDGEKTALHQPVTTLQVAAKTVQEPDVDEAKTLKM